MANITMAQLKEQFRNMEMEIKATLSMLEGLEGSTVIIGICPGCAPLPQNPPRLFARCKEQIGTSKEDVTIDDAEEGIEILSTWAKDMMTVLDGVDDDLPLP